MLKFIIIIFTLSLFNYAFSSPKEKVISQMSITNILSFEFIQQINEKSESGYCIIQYPKKIFCEYSYPNKKIMVSNGRSLVIKNEDSGSYYIYPLASTPLELLLDKEYLISKMSTLEPRNIDNKFLNFEIIENNNQINIFFDNKKFNLIGWQTEDIYKSLAITYISSVKINEIINNDIFKLPLKD